MHTIFFIRYFTKFLTTFIKSNSVFFFIQLAAKITLKIQNIDQIECTAQLKILPTDDDQAIVPQASELFDRALKRRIRVKQITLRLTNLLPLSARISLFSEQSLNPKIPALTTAMNKIRRTYGDNVVYYGRAA